MKEIFIGNFSLYEIAAYFFIYAFLGWITEVIFATLKNGKFVNRGFLNGPVCPIYGFGVVIVLLSLDSVKDNLLILFFASLLLTSILEFITGFVLEKFFHKKWWDYSKEPFNIKGYVCARFSLLWAVACVLVVNVIHPLIHNAVSFLPDIAGYIFISVFTAVIIVDLSLTVLQITQFGKNHKEIEILNRQLKAGSDKLGESVSNLTVKTQERLELLNNKIKNSRLVKAFPRLHREDKGEKTSYGKEE